MEKNRISNLIKSLDKELFDFTSNLICSICQELFHKPVTTICGHSYCSTCIKRFLSNKDNSGCPLCKHPLKRYDLESSAVKQTLSEICRELPKAFLLDLKDIQTFTKEVTEDQIEALKLVQMITQDSPNIKNKKKRTSRKKNCTNKSEECDAPNSEIETYVPVLKRSAHVVEYMGAKKKQLDDLISISQTEAVSHHSISGLTDLDKNLKNIEKIQATEKVMEWFETVGDNIFHNSLVSSPVSSSLLNDCPDMSDHKMSTRNSKESVPTITGPKHLSNGEKLESMIRVDYKKLTLNDSTNKSELKPDPYEFVPSQNKGHVNKKRKRSLGVKKKLPDFQVLHSFTKESVKRNSILQNQNQNIENETEDEETSLNEMKPPAENTDTVEPIITASQKFNQLLLETREEEKKGTNDAHTLFPGTQLSSAQFLDCSATSQFLSSNKSKKEIIKSAEEDEKFDLSDTKACDLFANFPVRSSKNSGVLPQKNNRRSGRGKRKQILTNQTEKFSEIMNLGSNDALELEESMEKYVKAFGKNKKNDELKSTVKKLKGKNSVKESTLLMDLLEEIASDSINIYGNHPNHLPLKLSNLKMGNNEESVQESKLKIFKPLEKQIDNFSTTQKLLKSQMQNSKSNEQLDSNNDKYPLCSQTVEMVGFCTQGELPLQEKALKEMVANLEKELQETELNVSMENEEANDVGSSDVIPCESLVNNLDNKQIPPPHHIEETRDDKSSNLLPKEAAKSSLVSFTLMGKIKKRKAPLFSFLQLGRLTPSSRRSNSSVVKLVFPTGFLSLSRKHITPKMCTTAVQTSPNSCHSVKRSEKEGVSVEVQTSAKLMRSTSIQTCQISWPSSVTHTSRGPNKSVAVQTSRINICNAEIQTSQSGISAVIQEGKSLGVQTSLELSQSTEVQRSCLEKEVRSVGNQTSQVLSCCNSETSEHDIQVETDIRGRTEDDVNDSSKSKNKRKREVKTPLKNESSGKNKKLKKTPSGETAVDNKNTCSEAMEECEWSNLIQNKLTTHKTDSNDIILESPLRSNRSSRISANRRSEAIRGKRNEKQDTFDFPNEEARESKRLKGSDLTKFSEAHDSRQLKISDPEKINEKDDKRMKDPAETESSDALILKVLRNIDLDLSVKNAKKSQEEVIECFKVEKSEESDSDFFVEQTPPRPRYSLMEESKNSRFSLGPRSLRLNSQEKKTCTPVEEPKEELKRENSFLVLSGEPADDFIPEFSQVNRKEMFDDAEKLSFTQCGQKTPQESSTKDDDQCHSDQYFHLSVQSTNENDQNRINISPDEDREQKIKEESVRRVNSIAESWKRVANLSQPKQSPLIRKRYCIVASSVKNPNTVRKFAAEFKMEYSNKPSKEMTHLIVGLHKNDDGEVLPLCTPKVLFAMANKKWVVSEAWAENSLKARKILDEEAYETCDPIGGLGCRAARLSTDYLFKNCEICLYGNFENVLMEELPDLILDSGGTLVQKPEKFSFFSTKIRLIIADKDCLNMSAKELRDMFEKFRAVVLSRDIIIMSIQSHKLSNFLPYLLHPASTSELIDMGYPNDLVKQEDSNWSSIT
ncbi:hypothetical protein RUM43_006868 [Polyplax serrata]|uniref:RING-type E3 ubiquitin transferase BRCA1 n=1 Tax=Polyplax serrata TaxID=468196 RepID=A0AAN8PLW8_POLSC